MWDPHIRRTVLAAALLLPAVARPAAKPDEIAEVTVTGESAHSFEEAKEDALRKAVEMGGGKIIRSHTKVQDFALVHDTILSRAVGYIKQYQPLAREEADGIFRLKIRAKVSLQKLEEGCGLIELLILRKGRPNLLVVVEEIIEGGVSTGNKGQYMLRDLFDKIGFDLLDDKMLARIGERDKLRAEIAGDWRRAASVAAQMHARFVVSGRATIRAGKPRTPYPGVSIRPVSVDLTIEIAAADTAQLLASKTGSAAPPEFQLNRDPVESAKRGLQVAVGKVGKSAVYRMLEHWSRDLDAGAYIELLGTRIDAEVLMALVKRLRNLDGVKSVNIVDPGPELTKIKVITRLDPISIAEEIKSVSGGRLQVTAPGQGRIEFKMAAEKTPPPLPQPPAPPPATAVTTAPQPPAGPPATAAPVTTALGPAQPGPGRVQLSLPLLIAGGIALVVLAVAVTALVVGRRRGRAS